ncbi:MAG TPA: phasin family protein [Planctomycetota bacterium]|jgi:polyhydroxyalkanoate synthesis regulator phasin|nr:phasin family protein [Planctomycetota bacterium]HPY74100.1 phasin family protein [Planctomycetota bacterium]HQA99646.1 phasin family protein [Planctomycetota bacterium]
MNKEQETWSNQLKKMVWAGMGVVAIAQDEFESFVNKLVERGELAEQDGKKWINEFIERGKKQKNDILESNTLEKMFMKFNIPTKKDIEELSAKIDQLTEQIETLITQKESQEEKNKNIIIEP